jgi:nitrate reductase delta subunit
MRLHQLLADVMGYPGPDLSRRIDECVSLSYPLHEGVAAILKEFREFLGKTPPGTMGEIYAKTFDLAAGCYPYVGYHLFGDGNHRGMFLAGLKEHYQIYGFSAGNELPDHLSVMLRFLARDEDQEERDEIVSLFILPALKKMMKGFRDDSNPYKEVLQALLLLLQEDKEVVEKQIARSVSMEEFRHD